FTQFFGGWRAFARAVLGRFVRVRKRIGAGEALACGPGEETRAAGTDDVASSGSALLGNIAEQDRDAALIDAGERKAVQWSTMAEEMPLHFKITPRPQPGALIREMTRQERTESFGSFDLRGAPLGCRISAEAYRGENVLGSLARLSFF